MKEMKKGLDARIRLTVRSIMMFEELTGKSFYEVDDSDMMDLLYCIVATSNPDKRITRAEFEMILKSKSVSRKMIEDLQSEFKYIESTSAPQDKDKDRDKDRDKGQKEALQEPQKPVRLSDIALSLVMNYGLDFGYVMDHMELWELAPLARAGEEKTKQDMVDKRFWTYLNIMPHIDAKKAGGPEKLIPFPWEAEDRKDNGMKFMKENEGNIMDFFKHSNDKENDKENEGKKDDMSYDEGRDTYEYEPAGLHQDDDEAGEDGEGGPEEDN